MTEKLLQHLADALSESAIKILSSGKTLNAVDSIVIQCATDLACCLIEMDNLKHHLGP